MHVVVATIACKPNYESFLRVLSRWLMQCILFGFCGVALLGSNRCPMGGGVSALKKYPTI
ncbi:MAG: hypothetical protein NWF02_00320 [Candidatus Bathyarchaeota archaeon]|nr:hypothetical protein [Candidatus Bathyarchaeum sp.]